MCAVLLLLTPEVLFVVDEFGDTQEQAYAMADISCLQSGADPSVVFIVPKASTKNGDADGDKVWITVGMIEMVWISSCHVDLFYLPAK